MGVDTTNSGSADSGSVSHEMRIPVILSEKIYLFRGSAIVFKKLI